MPRRTLERLRAAILKGSYDMTMHAVEEMAEDELDMTDVEISIQSGRIMKTEKMILEARGRQYMGQELTAQHM